MGAAAGPFSLWRWLSGGSAGALAHGREGSTLARGAAGTPLGSLALASPASSDSFWPPPRRRRRRPATRSPWALRSSEVLRRPRGRTRSADLASGAEHFSPFPSLPLSGKAPAEAVAPPRPQQIRGCAGLGRAGPRLPLGAAGEGVGPAGERRRGRGWPGAGGDSARARRLPPPPLCRRARADGARRPTLDPAFPAPGARTWPSPRTSVEGPRVRSFGVEKGRCSFTPPNFFVCLEFRAPLLGGD